MKNRGLVIKAKISMRNKKMDDINKVLEGINARSEELLSAIEASETEEDLVVLESQVEEVQKELDQRSSEKEALEIEIEELNEELRTIEGKELSMKKNRNKQTNEIAETRELLNEYIRSKGQKREGLKTVDGGALIPKEVLEPQKTKVRSVDLSKLVRVVPVTTGSGEYAVISKSKNKMKKTSELEKNPDLAKTPINKVNWTVDTYRGELSVSKEMIDDANYNIMGLVEEDAVNQEVNTKNFEIASILKSATAVNASGFDGLKDVINKKIPSVYDVSIVATDSMFSALDKVKDKEGRYMLQPDPTSPTGYKFKNKIIYTVPDDLLGAENDMKAFIGDVYEFVALFDREQTTVKWTPNEIYGEKLGLFSRFGLTKTNEEAGAFVTYTDAV
jgi:phage major capsid protein, HK97 family|uniref:Major capsid protein n=1 Tax=Siphoviridae sp. cttJO12 TaxID=2826492 RepID=A0A8S5R1M0_9CAUD|nr:MAG TPA: major capsid protein [Siphoviridae sp. cttJO12]